MYTIQKNKEITVLIFKAGPNRQEFYFANKFNSINDNKKFSKAVWPFFSDKTINLAENDTVLGGHCSAFLCNPSRFVVPSQFVTQTGHTF